MLSSIILLGLLWTFAFGAANVAWTITSTMRTPTACEEAAARVREGIVDREDIRVWCEPVNKRNDK